MHKELYMLPKWRYFWEDSGTWKELCHSSPGSWIVLMYGPQKPLDEVKPPFTISRYPVSCALPLTGLSTTPTRAWLAAGLLPVTYWLCRRILPEPNRFQGPVTQKPGRD